MLTRRGEGPVNYDMHENNLSRGFGGLMLGGRAISRAFPPLDLRPRLSAKTNGG